MSGLPGGYSEFCQARGINLWHPDSWSDKDLAEFYAWKLAWFKSLMQLYKLMPRLMPREHLKSRIREALDRLKAPPPTRPYMGQCPCHAPVFRRTPYAPETSHGVTYIESFRRKA